MALDTKTRTQEVQGVWGSNYYPVLTLTYRQNNYSVFMSMNTLPLGAKSYTWTAELQRFSNGSWSTIGRHNGYVSSTSPSHRQWNNIAVRGASMRIKYTLTRREQVLVPGGGYITNPNNPKTFYTFPWVR